MLIYDKCAGWRRSHLQADRLADDLEGGRAPQVSGPAITHPGERTCLGQTLRVACPWMVTSAYGCGAQGKVNGSRETGPGLPSRRQLFSGFLRTRAGHGVQVASL